MNDKVQQQLAALATAFLAQLPSRLDQLEEGMSQITGTEARDALQAVRDGAHKLAGAGATFGQAAVGEKAKALEHACDDALATQQDGTKADTAFGQADLASVNEAFQLLKTTAAAEIAATSDATETSSAAADGAVAAFHSDRVIQIISADQHRGARLSKKLAEYGFVVDREREKDIVDAVVADLATEASLQAAADGSEGRPIVYLGETDSLDERLAAVRRGGVGFLSHPVDVFELVEILNGTMERRRDLSIRVLVVDDDPLFCGFVQKVLESVQMTVTSLAKPGGIIEMLKSFVPDVILMDMEMPDYSGVDLTQVLGQHDQFRKIPVLFLSAHENIDLLRDAFNAGGVGFIRKPTDPKSLIATVESTVRRSGGGRGDSSRDALTGAFNHTYMMLQLARDLDRVRRAGSELTYAVFSVDHFSALNLAHGHEVADQILRRLVTVVTARVRRTDSCGRLAGAKFGLILPDATVAQVSPLISDIRAAVSEFTVLQNEESGGLTMSCGVASFPGFDTPESVSDGAEQAARAARRAGGDRQVAAKP